MKIELHNNKVLFNNGSSSQEIHPFWLRERVSNEEYFDNNTQQRKFDPTFLKTDISVNKFVTSFEFLQEDDEVGNESYLSNETSYNFDDSYSLKYRTRRNKKTD